MAKKTLAQLTAALLDPGFTPGRGDLAGLFQLLSDESSKAAITALARSQHPLAPLITSQPNITKASHRARLAQLAGRRLGHEQDAPLTDYLASCLGDPEPKVRRMAARSLGEAQLPSALDALLAAGAVEADPRTRVVLSLALSKHGADLPVPRDGISGEGAEATTSRGLSKAELIARRTRQPALSAGADTDSGPDAGPTGALPAGTVLRVTTTPGLEGLLLRALKGLVPIGRYQVDASIPGALNVRRVRDLNALLGCRMVRQASVVVHRDVSAGPVPPQFAAMIADAKTCDALQALVGADVRYRLGWGEGGKQRSATWDIVLSVERQRPQLLNTPRSPNCVITLRDTVTVLEAELRPKLDDPRFAYRKRLVSAATHPSLAAALVYVAKVQPGDVVWDPFVGSGIELAESWMAGARGGLFGTDIDATALDAARENLAALNVQNLSLATGDATSVRPTKANVIITNPPYGRRVSHGMDMAAVYRAFLGNARRCLAPGGRLVWLNPVWRRLQPEYNSLGFHRTEAIRVDLGGMSVMLERLDQLQTSSAKPKSQNKRSQGKVKSPRGR